MADYGIIAKTKKVRAHPLSVSKQSKATMTDVAKLAGVSKKTVSRVLNNEDNVTDLTRVKVQKAMAELDYHANMSARRLATHQSFLISMLYQEFTGNYIHDIQTGLLSQFSEYGYSLLVHPCGENDETTVKTVESMINQSNADGLILIPPICDMAPLIDCLERLDKPYVCISPRESASALKTVYCDDTQATKDLTQHLISLGHRKIGFVVGDLDRRDAHARLEGFNQAMSLNNIPINPDYIVQGDFNFDSGVSCGHQLLALSDVPTAIFASNDHMAAGVMTAAYEKGLKIPQELSVAGVDDSTIASEIWPPLTTIKQPTLQVGEMAADKLIKQIKKHDIPEINELLPWELVVRQTTASPQKP